MLTDAVKFLLNPFNILWILMFISAILWFLKNERWCRVSLYLLLGWLLISSTPLLPGILLGSLEERYEPIKTEKLEDIGAEYHIVVLGGGHSLDDRLPPNALLSLNALGRLNEGIRLHRQLPNSKLVLSGYSSSGRTTQAEMLQQTALLLGVAEKNTLMQKEPANTRQEAMIYSERFGTRHPVILVTSAAHMPRAMLLFERHGVPAVASPTNYSLKGSRRERRLGLPSTGNMSHLRSAMREYSAIARERVRQ